MATKMNENGVSTADNELFSCVKPTLEECRRQYNEWLKKKEDKK